MASVSRASVQRSRDHVVGVQCSYFDSLFFQTCLLIFFSKETCEYFSKTALTRKSSRRTAFKRLLSRRSRVEQSSLSISACT